MRAAALALVTALFATACIDTDGRRVPSSILRANAADVAVHPGASLAFVSERSGHPQVFTMSPGDQTARQLTAMAGSAFVGPIGPNDELLVVSSDGHGPSAREQLHVLADSELSALGPESRFVRNPSWLPDGNGVVYESDLSGFRNLFHVRLGGGDPEQLTDCRHGCFEPDVSPNGKQVAYASPDSGDGEIYSVDLESHETRRLTWSPGMDKRPAWSPNGDLIAFISSRDGHARIYLMNENGSRPRPLRALTESSETTERDHVWSPDGQYLAFIAREKARAGLRVVRVSDGTTIARSDGEGVDQTPSWAPSSSFIAFTSNIDENPEIYVMRPDGSARRRITNNTSADWLPRWRKSALSR
jgi:TolB protein